MGTSRELCGCLGIARGLGGPAFPPLPPPPGPRPRLLAQPGSLLTGSSLEMPQTGGCEDKLNRLLRPPPTSVHDARPFLNHMHLELGHVGERPAKFGKALPQQGRIVLGGAFLTNADQYHLLRHARLIDRQPHEQPCRWHAATSASCSMHLNRTRLP